MTVLSTLGAVTSFEVSDQRTLPSSASEALALHRAQLKKLAGRAKSEGYLFVAVTPEGVSGGRWFRARESCRAYSVGRHEACALVLTNEGAALRHLLVLTRLRRGRASARCFDLTSSTPGGADLPRLGVIEVPGAWLFAIATSKEAHALVDGSVLSPAQSSGSATGKPGGALRFPGAKPVAVTGAQLDAGVLLGRGEHCLSLGFELSETVSRVHAVLVRDDRQLVLADAGSTNGLRVDGVPTAVVELNSSTNVAWGDTTLSWRDDPCPTPAGLFPPGTAELVARVEDRADAAVLADWLIERGSPWGAWMSAALGGDGTDSLLDWEAELLGPVRALRGTHWSCGLLRGAELPGDFELNQAVLDWPLWRGLRWLRVEPGAHAVYDALTDRGLLEGLEEHVVHDEERLRRLLTQGRPVKALVVRDDALNALSAVLPSLPHLRALEIDGASADRLFFLFSGLKNLRRVVIRRDIEAIQLALRLRLRPRPGVEVRWSSTGYELELLDHNVDEGDAWILSRTR